MFDLQAISSVAPTSDLIFGMIAMFVTAVIANLLLIPKLLSRDARSAKIMLVLAVLGCIASVATLAIYPRSLYSAVLAYVVAFLLAGAALSWRSIGLANATARVTSGSICMLFALGFAHWAAHIPR